MAEPAEPDKGLLDRLNALKPTTVNLEQPSKPFISTIERAQPPSREDALADRLKSLRHQPESQGSPSSPTDAAVPQETSSSPVTSSTQPQAHRTSEDVREGRPATQPHPPIPPGEADPLATDDQILDELLAELELDESWLGEVAAEVSAENEHQRVTALLDEINKAPVETLESGPQEDGAEKDDDDSDGEQMRRETDDILAQAVDAANLDRPPQVSQSPEPNKLSTTPDDKQTDSARTHESSETDPHRKSDDPQADFELPAVPSDLKNQPQMSDTLQDDAAFMADITSRMAKLKSLGGTSEPSLPSVPTKVDDFGLPSAPSFSPGDRPVPGVYKKAGYTDEDEKTWCIVCLEDGAIRCLGCDGDVYCARCWKDMHVGPRAGYDERGHQWEKFVKGR